MSRAGGLARRTPRLQGTPPRQLLAWMRLLAAAKLLDHPDRSVESVARACGYASDSGLRRAFSDFLGTNPSALRGGEAFGRVADAFARELDVLDVLPQPAPARSAG